jgi:exonuclease III
MIGLIWNCRGVSKKGITTKVKDLYTEYKADFIELQETMRKNYTDKFFRGIDPQNSFTWHWLPSIGKSGGVLCGIKKEKFEVVKIEENEFLLSVEVIDKGMRKNLMLIMVYGPVQEDRRESFLTELAETSSKINIATLIGGDFNILKFGNEKNKHFAGNRYTDMFNWIINSFELRDLPFIGGKYTWSNNQSEPTLERLDRVLISSEWETIFPLTNLKKNPRIMSDHNPLTVSSDMGEVRKTKHFCFEISWVKHPEFSERIAEIWSRDITTSNAVERWHSKLNRVKKFLKGWGLNIKGHTRRYKNLLKEELANLKKKRGRRKPDCLFIGKENIYSNRTIESVGRRGIVLAQKV